VCKLLRSSQTRAGNGVTESLWLRRGLRRRGEGGLGVRGAVRSAEELDFLADGARQVDEGLADIGRVVVCFVGVLRGRAQELGVYRAESFDALFELDVVGWELGLREGRN